MEGVVWTGTQNQQIIVSMVVLMTADSNRPIGHLSEVAACGNGQGLVAGTAKPKIIVSLICLMTVAAQPLHSKIIRQRSFVNPLGFVNWCPLLVVEGKCRRVTPARGHNNCPSHTIRFVGNIFAQCPSENDVSHDVCKFVSPFCGRKGMLTHLSGTRPQRLPKSPHYKICRECSFAYHFEIYDNSLAFISISPTKVG